MISKNWQCALKVFKKGFPTTIPSCCWLFLPTYSKESCRSRDSEDQKNRGTWEIRVLLILSFKKLFSFIPYTGLQRAFCQRTFWTRKTQTTNQTRKSELKSALKPPLRTTCQCHFTSSVLASVFSWRNSKQSLSSYFGKGAFQELKPHALSL